MSGNDRFPDQEGGTVIDHKRLPSMNLEFGSVDEVREAINRAEYFDHVAVGRVDGYDVMVTARVTEATLSGGFHPKLTISVGGEWDPETGTYLGGSKTRHTFDHVTHLDDKFGKLCREHGLVIIPPGWPENTDSKDTDNEQ